MIVWKTMVNTAGDILGTSKLANLNRNVFRPIIGTGITREEYEMCNGNEIFVDDVAIKDKRTYENMGNTDRCRTASDLLNHMVDNGTVFSDRRVMEFCSNLPNENNTPPLNGSVIYQMSSEGQDSLNQEYSYVGQVQQRLRTISLRR